MTGSKPELGGFVRDDLLERYDSIVRAAGALGIGYDRLKKAIQQNKFNTSDLQRLGLGKSLEELRAEFTFLETRPYSSSQSPVSQPIQEDGIDGSLRSLFSDHEPLKKITGRSELTAEISHLYDRWIDGLTMVLFLHPSATPLEWLRAEKPLRRSMHSLIQEKRATIVYVFENFDDDTHRSRHDDRIDAQFQAFAEWIEEENGPVDDAAEGLIVLLRVPNCPYCTPHQKQSLFTWSDTEERGTPPRRAFTTIEIPATTDGYDSSGTIVAPLMRTVANDMIDQIERCTSVMRSGGPLAESITFKSYPEVDRGQLIQRLRKVV